MAVRITFVLPYYNEAAFIAATLESLARQDDRRFALVLVDNASTDGSAEIARDAVRLGLADIAVTWLDEPRPGKIHALETGLAAVTTELTGTLDADTIYPWAYVSRILALMDAHPAAAAVLALRGAGERPAHSSWLQSRLFPAKCHGGGWGQSFRTAALRRAGGFTAAIWPWVLEDHEIMARVGRLGILAYHRRHVCAPSDRRQDRSGVNWTIFERLLYKFVPAAWLPRFFHDFLGPRFERRGMRNVNLREQSWQPNQAER